MKSITAEYTPGIGWQYVVCVDGVLFGRYGNFNTESAALRAGKTQVGAA